MIPNRRTVYLFVCLTFILLGACEPLAPEQTPQYVVITGVSPAAIASPIPTSPVVETAPAGAAASTPDGAPVNAGASGLVSTPVPSITPVPPSTALPSATPYACEQTAGQVIQSSFVSAVAGGEVTYQMYLPPCFYESFKRYPYVVLLHGTGYDDSMWVDLGAAAVMDQGISKNTLPPMVLVMPDGGNVAEMNDEPNSTSYESMLLDELLPIVETDFCLWGSRPGRSIGGISRGGFWAFSIALRHPELFSAVGGHSPHFEVDNALPETNPLDLAGRVSLEKYPLRIYMDNAANDYVSANAIRMSDILRENGIEHKYLINPTGDHDTDYWSSHVAEYLSFYGQGWPFDVSALPSCLEPSP